MEVSSISVQNNLYANNQPSFGSRCAELRKVDNLCRRVKSEFPLNSGYILKQMKSSEKTPQMKNYVQFISECIGEFRAYYTKSSTAKKGYYREILGLKKNRVGNCGEYSDVAALSLRLNGYQDVHKLALYAYNPKTGWVRSIDHNVAGANIRIPKGYKEFNPEKEKHAKIKHLIIPDKDGIIFDALAGFADSAKNAELNYKNNYWVSGFAQKNTKVSHNVFNLSPDEKIGYMIEPEIQLKKQDFEYFKTIFPNLILTNKQGTKGPEIPIKGVERAKINGIRVMHNIAPVRYKPLHAHHPIMPPEENTGFKTFMNGIKSFFTNP